MIPDSVEVIDNQAFNSCSSLKYITFGSNLERIGRFAFQKTAIESIDIPANVEVIDNFAFM